MDWDNVRFFLAVYRRHSLRAAARQLGVDEFMGSRLRGNDWEDSVNDPQRLQRAAAPHRFGGVERSAGGGSF
jgi:hypothetical protein